MDKFVARPGTKPDATKKIESKPELPSNTPWVEK
jgi:hypothetical protein